MTSDKSSRAYRLLLVTALALLALAAPANAAFPGKNGKIVFHQVEYEPCFDPPFFFCFGYDQLHTINPDGTGDFRVTDSPEDKSWPAWSPDGQRIVFEVNHLNRPVEMQLVNSDGTGLGQIGSFPAYGNTPAWAPDGNRIVFSYVNGVDYAIQAMNANGINRVTLTHSPYGDAAPAWSPDGNRIAFERFGQIYTMNSDGTQAKSITPHLAGSGAQPNWSPDGRQIVFFRYPQNTSDLEISVINADGSGLTDLTSGHLDLSPAWSPDGTRIVFERSGSIYTMKADGTDLRFVTFGQHPDWQPIPNRPPDCSHVTATPDTLWPPNHKLVPLSLSGATDPDGDQVTLTISGVTQDEPTGSSPDAVLGPASNDVSLRPERDGSGDGRVYRIAFKATDGRGGECTGTATVVVPHDHGSAAVNSAPPSYDSLVAAASGDE